MNWKRVLVLVLLLLLCTASVVFFSSLNRRPATSVLPSPREATQRSVESCCEFVANPALENEGRVVVTFPAGLNLSRTMVYLYPPGGATQVALSTGNPSFAVPPGTYDVGIHAIRLAAVPVQAGFDTRVRVGALRVSTDNATTYHVLDAADQHELAKGYGHSIFGLPVGRYVLRLKQDDKLVEIEDGGIADF